MDFQPRIKEDFEVQRICKLSSSLSIRPYVCPLCFWVPFLSWVIITFITNVDGFQGCNDTTGF